VALIALASALSAQSLQTNGRKTDEQWQTSIDAHKAEFDYLLGDWEFTAVSKQWGQFNGRWSAVKLAEGQILDEFRILDDQGGTVFVTTTIRNWNADQDQWELIGADPGDGLRDLGIGHWVAGEMRIEQTINVARGNPLMSRIRYHHIRPDAFSWVADRSTDGGKTWVIASQAIEARRVGPARSLGALVPRK
jgi:hypothetical protein